MHHAHRSRHLRRLLGGTPAFILALTFMPAIASAQTVRTDSEGRTTLTTEQRSQDAPVTANSLVPPVVIGLESLADSSLAVTNNSLAVAATAQAAVAELASDDKNPPHGSSRATIQADAVDAEGSILILGRQLIRRSPVVAEAPRSSNSITIGPVSTSRVAIEANSALADARGNEHLATLSSTSPSGVALLQRTDGSSIRAVQTGIANLRVASADRSTLALSGNRQQANAAANASDVSSTSTSANDEPGTGSTAIDGDGNATIEAGTFVLQSQHAAGPTVATAGNTSPSGVLVETGALTGSALAIGGNSLAARGSANSAIASIALTGTSIASDRLAAALTSQRLDGQAIALTVGRAQANIAGAVAGSTIDSADNSVLATATGNLSDTALGIAATSITSGSSENRPTGMAMVEGEETRTGGTLAAHTDQRVGTVSIQSGITRSGVALVATGPIEDSSIIASGNIQRAEALANRSASHLAIETSEFSSAAGLLLSQSSNASISATAGDAQEPAGDTVAPAASIASALLSVTGNAVETLATGNRAENLLSLSASTGSGDDSLLPQAGAIGDGFGATATLALTSVQKVGLPDSPSLISSNATGRFGVTGNGAVLSSTINVDGNHHAAGASANSADNVLSVSGSSLDGLGTALASSQFASSSVRANAVARFVAPGLGDQSDITIARNTNQASATLNNASNRLSVTAAQTDDGPATQVRADMLGSADAQGRNVLSNSQFAMGQVGATVTSAFIGSSGSEAPGLVRSRFRIIGNGTIAEASANRASNSLDLQAASGGIASSQMNTANVVASAQADIVAAAPLARQRIESARLTVDDNRVAAVSRGNFVQNDLSVTGLTTTGTALAGMTDARVRALAPVAVASSQVNYGSVGATVAGTGVSLPLNAGESRSTDLRLAVGGNSLSAAAFANGAVNAASTSAHDGTGTALVSAQINYAPVLAQVAGGMTGMAGSDLSRSSLTISDNHVTATATGNIASNLVGMTR